MSVDLLQERIRKLKNPSVLDMTASVERIPPSLMNSHGNYLDAYAEYCRSTLYALKDFVPAVRFRFANFTLYGPKGLSLLQSLLDDADEMGYYVLLDCVQILSPDVAQQTADILFRPDNVWTFNGLIVPTYIGSDGLKPLVKGVKGTGKSVFGIIRTGNKSAAEIQDLLSGNRLSHMAAADLVNRLGEPFPGRSGYNLVGAVAGASSADSICSLRSKYPKLFLILDGCDYPNANMKNCSFAFDKFGHGAAVCVGDSVLSAWLEAGSDGSDFVECAVAAAKQLKRKVDRYVTIL